MTLDERILQLLSRWEDLREQGQTPTAEELCRDCPDLLAEVKRRVDHLERLTPCSASTTEGEERYPLPPGQPTVLGGRSAEHSEAGLEEIRYHVLRFHARGGLGEVFVAQDSELHREVALKRIRPGRANDPDSRRRFLLEAEITGQLEHPGVVPVHGLLHDHDGQPVYAMRFVQGETLQQAVERFHGADQPGRDPGERSLALRQLLNRFLAVCNTMGYAHSRGVLHRDLKPANIMLGKFGETLILDWGLAKPFEHGTTWPSGAEERVVPRSASGDSSTQMGEVIGTPAYMSPEQAAGRWDAVGPASDIYSLGATLYTLLTGQPPVEARHLHHALDQVKRGQFPPPRQRKRLTPPTLEAICLKAMARRPEDRYATALDLAADVEHWLADEPVTAYREPLPARLGRWMRRHRAWASGAAALLVTTVVGLTVGLLAVNYQKGLKERALLAETRARRRARQAMDAMSSPVIENLLSKQGIKLDPAQEEFLKQAMQYYQEAAAEEDEDAENRHAAMSDQMRVGSICLRLGQHATAEEADRKAIAIGEQLVAAFPTTPEYRQDLAKTQNNLGVLLRERGRLPEAEAAWRGALDTTKQLADLFPGRPNYRLDLAKSQSNLGNLLAARGHAPEAEDAYRQAVATLSQLAAEFPTVVEYRGMLAASLNNLGVLLMNTDRPEQAEKAFSEAIATHKKLANDFPANPEHRLYLANGEISLAFLLRGTGRLQEAEAAYREALAVFKRLAAEFPTVPLYRRGVGIGQNDLGVLLAAVGRLAEADANYRDALATRKQLAADFSNVPDYQDDLAATMVSLADLLCDRREFSSARSLLEEAQPHHRAALEANSANPTSRYYYRGNRAVLVRVLAGLGEEAAALAAAEQLARLGWDPPVDTYAAAAALTQAIAVVEKDEKLPTAKRTVQAQAYGDRAMDMLRRASANGYQDVPRLEKDTDLDPLRRRQDFRKLLEQLRSPKARGANSASP